MTKAHDVKDYINSNRGIQNQRIFLFPLKQLYQRAHMFKMFYIHDYNSKLLYVIYVILKIAPKCYKSLYTPELSLTEQKFILKVVISKQLYFMSSNFFLHLCSPPLFFKDFIFK